MSIRRLAPVPILLATVPWLPGSASVQGVEDRTTEVRTLLEKWVETRRVISKEQRERALGRETLSGRIRIVGREIESVRARIAELEKSIAEADARHAELAAEDQELVAVSAGLRGSVGDLEGRTRDLLRRLPVPAKDRVRLFSQRIPEDPAATDLRLGRRYESVVAVLNELNKLHNEVTLGRELLELPDGGSAEVSTLYVGLGQGYYVGLSGRAGGTGSAAPDGWRWRAADDAAPRITRALAILGNEQVAGFVPLPIAIE